MSKNTTALFGAATPVAVPAEAATDQAAIDQAFEALKAYGHGSSRGPLMPIDDAVRTPVGQAAARRELERRLLAALKGRVSPVAKEYVCAKLGLIGSAASVSTLAELLTDNELADAARSALEALPGPEALKALRDSLPKLVGRQKAGVINSLGIRRDARGVAVLASLLPDSDNAIAGAAAAALGNIGTVKAARSLLRFQPKAPGAIRLLLADACLACAERLMTDGNKAEALAVYKALTDSDQPKQVRQAASHGLSLAAPKN